ncbi:hypothetical protein [Lunatibacter salilacus]|uniref:hypothetical protein n=1 Tax=Lunatibacter salilacus TaxID=2483804 RepID=UPI001F202363|nr:hypothetical protein [Lunatibacter salilacus]
MKQSIGIGASMVMLPLVGFPSRRDNYSRSFSGLWENMVAANDEFIQDLMDRGEVANRHGGRSNGYNFAKLAAGYACKDSYFYKNPLLIDLLDKTTDNLIKTQRPDGTINAGNLESPPDTAFIMEPVCAGVVILSQIEDVALSPLMEKIKVFVEKVGRALVVGGIHTPNHRWVLCHALARINQLYPDPSYVRRIDEWLSEGIFIDEDGHYPERSMNYSDVENNAFITMGRLLNRPELLEAPRKSLTMTYYYMEPNGDLITTDSRRQDQYSHRSIVGQYLHYRFLAIHDQDGTFAHIVSMIEGFPGFDKVIVNEALFYFMENEMLIKDLPEPTALPTTFEKVFKTSSLARIRREDTTVTIFGGVDWPLIIASGRSVSPNFFSYRKGNAVLKHMRMSAGFFSMGYFRSQGLRKEGNSYILHQKLEAPYYQPLPEELRNKEGDYNLTPSIDGRFWSKMSFDQRPVSNVKTLDTEISITEDKGKVTLGFEVNGLEGVEVTIEFCFDEAGTLLGTIPASIGDDNYFLPTGSGSFECGGDTIHFGPGAKLHERIVRLEGEQYSVHFGTLRTKGKHVYLTGITPFVHTLTFG